MKAKYVNSIMAAASIGVTVHREENKLLYRELVDGETNLTKCGCQTLENLIVEATAIKNVDYRTYIVKTTVNGDEGVVDADVLLAKGAAIAAGNRAIHTYLTHAVSDDELMATCLSLFKFQMGEFPFVQFKHLNSDYVAIMLHASHKEDVSEFMWFVISDQAK